MKQEMEFLTGVITEDIDYLLYLLLKKPKIVEKKQIQKEKTISPEEQLDNWFNSL